MRFLSLCFLVPENMQRVLIMVKSNSIKFHSPILRPLLLALIGLSALISSALGQATNKNNPYSPSPEGKIKGMVAQGEQPLSGPIQATFAMQGQNKQNRPSVTQLTDKTDNDTEVRSMPPTEIYKVGIGDVLFVNLKNSTRGSRFCVVQADGTIDFPLAGENLIAADRTVDSIEKILAASITLFSDPRIEVKVREYASHKIAVSGMVENPGDKSLRREAIPLFVIRSEAVVSLKATRVLIKRSRLGVLESYELRDADTDNVLIYSGDAIEFAGNPKGLM